MLKQRNMNKTSTWWIHTQLSQLFLLRELQKLPLSFLPRSGDHFLECWKCPWQLCPAVKMLVIVRWKYYNEDRLEHCSGQRSSQRFRCCWRQLSYAIKTQTAQGVSIVRFHQWEHSVWRISTNESAPLWWETWLRVVPRPRLGIHPPPCPAPAMWASRTSNQSGGAGGAGGDDNHRSYVGSRLQTKNTTPYWDRS